MKIQALIAATEAAIAAENDPKKLRDLQAKLAMFVTTRAEMDDDGDDDDPKNDPDGDDKDGSKAAKAAKMAEKAKKAAEAAKHRSKAAEHRQKMEEAEEEAKKCEMEDEEKSGSGSEEAKAHSLAAVIATIGGQAGQHLSGELQALIDKASASDRSASRIATIEQERAAEKRDALITGALRAPGGPRITPANAKWLKTQPLSTVTSYLAQHTKAIVNTDEVRVENDGRASNGLGAEVSKQIDLAVAAGADRAKLVAAHLEMSATQAGKATH